MINTRQAILILVILFTLSGCAGFVGGDLKNINTDIDVNYCDESAFEYHLSVSTEAENDYGSDNLSGKISSYSFGLIPTYWLSSESSQVEITQGNEVVYSRTDESRIHKFYGFLWLFVFFSDGVNSLDWDEGAGLRVEEGIKDRAIAKTVMQLPQGIDSNQLCVESFYFY
ncbi:hypothetical protein [Reinekea thalattae]|uniref:Uncharacterized protein n=1 Tax=Reinekea thalattae TaxID=2593301 RepID=A0A5C8Z8E8_9GAMM|nr:hypothetical protein [Reinekea thalattae]TXR53126.1 hypothetical protein FME95_00685 [Reinekea thalattae]